MNAVHFLPRLSLVLKLSACLPIVASSMRTVILACSFSSIEIQPIENDNALHDARTEKVSEKPILKTIVFHPEQLSKASKVIDFPSNILNSHPTPMKISNKTNANHKAMDDCSLSSYSTYNALVNFKAIFKRHFLPESSAIGTSRNFSIADIYSDRLEQRKNQLTRSFWNGFFSSESHSQPTPKSNSIPLVSKEVDLPRKIVVLMSEASNSGTMIMMSLNADLLSPHQFDWTRELSKASISQIFQFSGMRITKRFLLQSDIDGFWNQCVTVIPLEDSQMTCIVYEETQ